jgi:hypothetical protein
VSGTWGTHGRVNECVQDFDENPEGKRPLERPRRRWEDVITVDLRETGWGGVECIQLAQGMDRWRALVMNLWVLAPRSQL